MAKTKNPKIKGQDENIKLLKTALRKNMPVLLIGETGSGKTGMVQYVAELQEKEVIRFNLTGDTTTDEFVGKLILKDGKTEWQDGVLLQAMKKGKVLVVDEINVALPEVLFVLNSLLDDGKAITVSENEGEQVKPHKDFRFVATMNPPAEYSGTKELNKALLSRFKMILQVDYPPADVEEQLLIERTGVDKETAYKMIQISRKLRNEKKDNNIYYTCSTRDLLQWAEVYQTINGKRPLTKNLAVSFQITILNKADSLERDTLIEIFKTTTNATDDVINMIKEHSGGDFVNVEELKQIYDKVMREKEVLNKEKAVFANEKVQYKDSIRQQVYSEAESDLQKHFEGKLKEIQEREKKVDKKVEAVTKLLKD